ncbi:MAG: hypothetical protein R2851_21350 [Caldilineaceae bacterium]
MGSLAAPTHMALLLDVLHTDHRAIAPDLRGYGLSVPPSRTFRPISTNRMQTT